MYALGTPTYTLNTNLSWKTNEQLLKIENTLLLITREKSKFPMQEQGMLNQYQSFRTPLVNPSKQESCFTTSSNTVTTSSISGTMSTSRSSFSSLGSSSSRTEDASSIPRGKWSSHIQTGNNKMDNHIEDRNYFASSTTATRSLPITPSIRHDARTYSYSDHHQTYQTLHSTLDESKMHTTNTGKSGHDFNVMMQAPLVLTPADKNRATNQRSYDQERLNMLDTFPRMYSPIFESNRARHMEEARAHETNVNPVLFDAAFSNTIGSTRAIQHKFNDFDLFTNPYLHEQTMTSTTSAISQYQELDIHPRDRQSGTYFTNAVFNNVCKVLSSPSDQNLRQKMPIGFPGLACCHCQGLSRKRNGGRYFPSFLKTLSDSKKTLFAIYQHLQNCDKCPEDIKKDLQTLMSGHEEERRKQRRGSQTSYFLAVWQAVHGSPPPDSTKRYRKKKA